MGKKRILFGASYSAIEPLGLLHLAGLARDEGWERTFHLVKNHNFNEFFERVEEFKPDVVGFNVYTGNHIQLAEAFKKLKKDYPNISTIVGGPHPTYFPEESKKFGDYVVMSEGFGALKKILRGEAKMGILPMESKEEFPHPDRKTFYSEYPEHGKSKIKSIITMTGCPYTCTYCYNSSTPEDLKGGISPELAEQLAKKMGIGGRLFPNNVRSVESIVKEGIEISENWPTKLLYVQDDVHGLNTKGWLQDFAFRWPKEVGLPYHAQMRWEMTANDDGKRRLDLIQKAGCFGLTLAIEAADPIIRKEVLSRAMPENLMYDGMKDIIGRGLKVRTEQITGLPYGATTERTAMNLEADLQLVELNVDLRKKTGGPNMAWASTLAPYKRTKLGSYCEEKGHYSGDNSDVPDTFFDKSVLKFPKEWVGPRLEQLKFSPSIWLDSGDLERYRDQNAELRRIFNFVTLVPEGHKLARNYLTSEEPFSYERLGRETEEHLLLLSMSQNQDAAEMLANISSIRKFASNGKVPKEFKKSVNNLAPYFASIPKPELAIERAISYAQKKENNYELTPNILSTAIRHHLYDEVLYAVNQPLVKSERIIVDERYPAKV